MDRTSRGHILIRIAQGLIISMLLIAPFPFGAVENHWVFSLELCACLLLALWAVIQIASGEVRLIKTSLALPLAALFCYLLTTLLPLNRKLLELLSPETAALYRVTGTAMANMGEAFSIRERISLTPFDTEGEIIKLAAYVIFFFACLNFLRYKRGYIAAAYAVIVTGTTVAFLGIVQNNWSNGRIYWSVESGSGTPFGPFANHNHFAGYIELTLGLSLGMLVAEVQRYRSGTRSTGILGQFAWTTDSRGTRVWLLLVATLVMVLSLTASLSRGGLLSFVFTSLLFGIGLLLRRKKDEPSRGELGHRRVAASAGLIMTMAAIAMVGASPPIRARWGPVFNSAAIYRAQIWKETFDGIRDFPVTGTGLGSFQSTYPRYKSSLISSETTHAENEYLEWLYETGLAGAVLLLLAGSLFVRRILLTFADRRDAFARCITLGAAFSLASISIHNGLDFNMHIPSNALTCAAIAAICMIAIHSHEGRGGDRFLLKTFQRPSRAPIAIAAIALSVFLAALLGERSFARYRSLRLLIQAELNESPTSKGDPDERKLARLSRSLSWAPWNDRALYSNALIFESAAAGKTFLQMVKKRELLEQAARHIREAIVLCPGLAAYWAALGRIEARSGRFESAGNAFERALFSGRIYGYIHCDYAQMLLCAGDPRLAARHFRISRDCLPTMGLREMLENLSSATSDEQTWKSILKHQPEDYAIYTRFLRDHGLDNLAEQAEKETEALEKIRPRI